MQGSSSEMGIDRVDLEYEAANSSAVHVEDASCTVEQH